MSQKSVKHVIADSGAFIRNAPLQTIGEHIYTLPEVIKEIKDKATLQRLQVLPYNIEYRTPSQESIIFVSNFAKKTGDYKSLSAVDIKVMALTYQLEKEKVGTEHIKSAPEKKIEWNTTTKLLEKPTDIAGFYLSDKKGNSRSQTSDHDLVQESCDTVERNNDSHDHLDGNKETCDVDSSTKESFDKTNLNENRSEICEIHSVKFERNSSEHLVDIKTELNTKLHESGEIDSNKEHPIPGEGEVIQSTILEEVSDSEESIDEGEDDTDDDDDDDDDGWITPGNIKEVKQKMGEIPSEQADVMVGCLTMDFAIQNVLIQMGLNVISVDGMLIKRAKSYVLRCFACMKITTNVMKEFCPFCGNNTLQKVSMTVEDDGSIRYYLSRRRPLNTRGLKYSIPLPKGGKHAKNIVLCEDQRLPQQRTTKKSKQKLDVFDPDYIANYSPFAVNDITSRASQLGIRSGRSGHNKRNPNEVRKNYGRRK